MKLLICLLFTCIGLSAQGPQPAVGFPPSPFSPVGSVLRRQAVHWPAGVPLDESQAFGLFATPNAVTPNIVGLGPEILSGAELFFFSASCELSAPTWVMQMSPLANESYHFFTLSLLSNNVWLLPFGKVGHDTLYSDPTFMLPCTGGYEVGVPPVWAMTPDVSTVAVTGPWLLSYLYIRLPGTPALIGLPFSSQSVRIQNAWNIYTGVYGPTLFASDEIVFTIS